MGEGEIIVSVNEKQGLPGRRALNPPLWLQGYAMHVYNTSLQLDGFPGWAPTVSRLEISRVWQIGLR